MVYTAMNVKDQYRAIGSDRSMPLHGLSETVKDTTLNKQLNPVDEELLPKIRKPYTITKQRERWTEEEHKNFLKALKLYGRAWRKIEEHVGTKTAVQIRSHAQKFFSKVTRDSNTGEDKDTSLKTIEIPPPRPKRKPMHPYPRKMVTLVKPRISIPEKQTSLVSTTELYVSEQDNQSSSPSSVSAVGSDAYAINGILSPVSSNLVLKVIGANFSSEVPNTLSDDNSAIAKDDLLSSNESASGQCLKLFGKTLVFADNQGPYDPLPETCEPGSLDMNESDNTSPKRVVPITFVADPLTWLTLSSGLSLSKPEILSPIAIKARLKCDDKSNESCSTRSDSDNQSSEERSRVVDSYPLFLEFKGQVKNLSKRISADSLKGFVPYKRCVMNPEEREKQCIRLRI